MTRLTPILIAASLALPALAFADPRPFTFNYDTYAVGKGNAEYEQWVTYKTRTDEDNSYTRFDFRQEIEYGLSDNFDISIYFADFSYENTDAHTGAQYDDSAVETIYYVTNPVEDFIGLGLYNEIAVGDGSLAFEQKILVQKDIGNWTLIYNLVFETELEGVFKKNATVETEGVLGNTFGVSYALPFAPGVRFGAESVIESIYADWNDYQHTTCYAGPNISYTSAHHWWLTLTGLYQLSSVDDEPDYVLRLIAGWEF